MVSPVRSAVAGIWRQFWWHVAVASGACVLSGHHNTNYVVRAQGWFARALRVGSGTYVKIRFPIQGALSFDRRDWPSEEKLLRALARIPAMKDLVSQVVRKIPTGSVHRFVEGEDLEALAPTGTSVSARQLDGIEELFRVTATVSRADLPALPADAPSTVNEFLKRQATFTLHNVYECRFPLYGRLFDGLGVTRDLLDKYIREIPDLYSRPLILVHGDLHRRNIVVRPDGGVIALDWELALYGDPVYELATHLWLMRYPDPVREDVTLRWKRALSSVSENLIAGADEDLPAYLKYKRVQSLVNDVVRCADRFNPDDEPSRKDIARTVVRVVAEAQESLGLPEVPEPDRVEWLYQEWHETSSRERCKTDSTPGKPTLSVAEVSPRVPAVETV